MPNWGSKERKLTVDRVFGFVLYVLWTEIELQGKRVAVSALSCANPADGSETAAVAGSTRRLRLERTQ